MKNFKDLVSEVATDPKAPEEKRFKDQHTIEVIPHPVALDSQFTGDIDGIKSGKRIADKVDDEKDYDQAYKKPKKVQTLPLIALPTTRESAESDKKSITEILGVNAKKPEDKKPEDDQEESACGDSDTLKAEKKPKVPAKKADIKQESDTDSADTLEKQSKPKPSQVTIKDSNGKTISLTFKEMLDKVSTEDELLESPQQEIPMMMKQLHFVCYAAEEIGDYLKTEGQDPEEWWQNKLAEVFSNVKSLYAYAKGDQMVNAKPLSAAKIFAKASRYEEIEAGSFELSNSETVEISEEDASLLNIVFENLNENNTNEMYSVLIADEAGYNEILSFAKDNV
tara:strand:+ start:2547 stop:3560 length:1014 start_codon:yes stop_codon:yes gene_type:complete